MVEDRIATLTEEEMVMPGSDGGWSVKDHLAHLVSWTEKALAVLRGQPAHEGLKVDERTYLEANVDDLNARLHERNRDHSLEKVLVDFRQSHLELLSMLEMMVENLVTPLQFALPGFEDLLDRLLKQVGDFKSQRQAGIILPILDGIHGLAGNSQSVRQVAL